MKTMSELTPEKLGEMVVSWYQRQIDAGAISIAAGGHVVELVDKPEPEVLDEDDASVVEKAKQKSYPAQWISEHAHKDPYDTNTQFDEERLMRAYVNGYVVKKPKRYLLQLPDTEDSDGEYALYAHKYEGRWEVDEAETDPDYAQPTVTEADLKDAPQWVKAIKPVEVRDE